MSFKSQKEIWEHLIAGGKVRMPHWEDSFIYIGGEGHLITNRKDKAYHAFEEAGNWQIYQEPKPKRKITLYNHTYQMGSSIYQTGFSSLLWEEQDLNHRKLLMTETKEIEVDA